MRRLQEKQGRARSLAIVTAFYPPTVGGVERFSQEFARAALDIGLSVNVVATAPVQQPELTVEDGGIRILRIPACNIPFSGSYFPIPVAGRRLVGEFLNCDIVMAQTRFFPTTMMAAGMAAIRGRRIYVVDHGAGPLRSAPAAMVSSMAYEHLVTLALRLFSPRFVAVSAASAQWLGRFGVHNARVVPNGVEPREKAPVRDRRSFVKPIVFYAGRLFEEKGIIELVNGVASLRRQGIDIELRVAGQGPLAGALQRRALKSDFLVYLGGLSPEDVAGELERATVLVNPSNLGEGFSRILLEAGAAALPAISTPYGACRELIEDGVTGWLIPRGRADVIASCLEKVISQPEESIRRGVELFRLVQQKYTWPSIVRRFLEDAESDSA
ncbi:MAG TPA: glycosyltransferase family 4 protein [Candidatus Cybelea sp.]|jgi:glycosyltransferase involved in cell wall biosynthesis